MPKSTIPSHAARVHRAQAVSPGGSRFVGCSVSHFRVHDAFVPVPSPRAARRTAHQDRMRSSLVEAAAQNLLRHPAFVAVHDVFVEQEGVCLVRPRLFVTLRHFLSRNHISLHRSSSEFFADAAQTLALEGFARNDGGVTNQPRPLPEKQRVAARLTSDAAPARPPFITRYGRSWISALEALS